MCIIVSSDILRRLRINIWVMDLLSQIRIWHIIYVLHCLWSSTIHSDFYRAPPTCLDSSSGFQVPISWWCFCNIRFTIYRTLSPLDINFYPARLPATSYTHDAPGFCYRIPSTHSNGTPVHARFAVTWSHLPRDKDWSLLSWLSVMRCTLAVAGFCILLHSTHLPTVLLSTQVLLRTAFFITGYQLIVSSYAVHTRRAWVLLMTSKYPSPNDSFVYTNFLHIAFIRRSILIGRYQLRRAYSTYLVSAWT